ncbi:hypothetical protein ABIE21_002444 [Conyzicola nivalis]|uniref:Uncharacterized protein n=2 Tax=Conyzicola nivalis TaxID=1477021 RepID=A0ABV2QPF5_9MICO
MRHSPTLQGQAMVLPISATEWRISDPRRSENDALCLIGFVQQIDQVFETTRIGRPLERRFFVSLSAAVEFLTVP